MQVKLQTIYLTVGKTYMVTGDGFKLIHKCKFIKSTPKGYNFYIIDRNKLLFKTHIYPVKGCNDQKFWLLEHIKVTECGEDELKCITYLQYKEQMKSANKDYS